jgi:lipoprotein-anchoring transpeptidase ErfK/SrfK
MRLMLGAGTLLALAVAACLLLFDRTDEGKARGALIPAAHAEELIPAPPPSLSAVQPQVAASPVAFLPVDRWLASGEYVWGEETGRGPITIVVDVRARTLSVYRKGVEIGRSSVVYGFDEKPTPLGVHPVLEKDADHVSNLYGAPMPWMLRLTWDGVAIHGSMMADDRATHGCVGVPEPFAKTLFALAAKGTRVLVNDGPPNRANYAAYAALPYGAAL